MDFWYGFGTVAACLSGQGGVDLWSSECRCFQRISRHPWTRSCNPPVDSQISKRSTACLSWSFKHLPPKVSEFQSVEATIEATLAPGRNSPACYLRDTTHLRELASSDADTWIPGAFGQFTRRAATEQLRRAATRTKLFFGSFVQQICLPDPRPVTPRSMAPIDL